MQLRFAAVSTILALSSLLTAQTNFQDTGSLAALESYRVVLDIDHGSTPTAVTLTVDVSTLDSAGLIAVARDLDLYLAEDPAAQDDVFFTGMGSDTITLVLPARAGVHQVELEILAGDFFSPIGFDMTAGVSAGTITAAGSLVQSLLETGVFTPFGRFVEYRKFVVRGTYQLDFSLDFGPMARQATIALWLEHYQDTAIRLLDTTSTPPVELASWPSQPFGTTDEVWLTTAAHSGVASFRLEFVVGGGSGTVNAEFLFESDVVVTGATETGFAAPPPSQGGGGGGGTCAAGGGGGIAALLALLSVTTCRARRGARPFAH